MRLRPGLRLWHRWFGILAGVWLALLAITGSAIAWYDELDTWLNPDWRRAAVTAGAPVSLDTIEANAQAALPGFALGNLLLAKPGATHWLLGRQELPEGGVRAVQLFADPGTGEILGWRESGALVFDRRHLPDLLYGLHTEFLAGEIGAWVVGIIGLAWLLDHLLALPLAWPRWRQWHAAFLVSGPRGSLRRLFDWHRAKGVWLWPLTLVLAVTGITLTFPEASRHAVEELSPVNPRLHETMAEVDPPAAPIGLDRALLAGTRDGEPAYAIRPFPGVGVYGVRSFDPRDIDGQGRLWTYVRMSDGAVVGRRHDVGESAGDVFFAWQYALHSGRAAGDWGRVIVTLLGLALVLLCYTGWKLVLRRSVFSRNR